MKKLLLLTLATWACTAIGAAAQVRYVSPQEPPSKLLPGAYTLTETAWLVSSERMRFYNELHLNADTDNGSDVTALLGAYDRASKTDSLAYVQLLDVATKGNAELRKLLESQRQSIMLAQANSQAVLVQNDQMLTAIKDLKKDLKKANRGRTWRTIGWVLSAAAAGFLVAQF